jgi:non-ribosomal peptide synthetase component F
MIVAGRVRVELENLIGCFTNTLIIRTDVSGTPSFTELLRQVRERLLEAYAHQDLPFEKLLEELRPERSPRHHPLFQVLFNYLDVPRPEAAIPGLVLGDFEVSLGTASVDLAVNVEPGAEGLTCDFVYSTDLFDKSTIAGLAEQYLALLDAATADPERRLSALPVSPATGRTDDTESILRELERLSDEEAERLLAAELRNHTP